MNLIDRGGRALLLCAALLMSPLLSGCSTWECDASTCADGCCDSEGTCRVGGSDQTACGLGGRACQDCYQKSLSVCSEGRCCFDGRFGDCTSDADCCDGLRCLTPSYGGTRKECR